MSGPPPNMTPHQHQPASDDAAAANDASAADAAATANAPANAAAAANVFQQFPRSRTPQMQPGGSPSAAAHLQMHPHLQSGHLQPRSPLVAAGNPGSVPQAGNPATPQMMQQQMGMNQPMSLPAAHVSRPSSVAPPSSVPANLHSTTGGPPSNQMEPLGHQQQQYPMHLQPQQQQTPSRPGSQQSQLINPASGGGGGGSVQRPGSVLAPGSVQPPGSHGPQSVQAYGPGSVNPPGSAQAPSSVQPASSFAPGSVQAPASQQPPSSIQPPPSAASASGTASASKEPLKPNEEQIRMVQDPVDLVRNLVQKDLRNSLVEMNRRAAELVRQKEVGEIGEEDKAQYKRATNDFHAVCDEIDRTLTTVMETAKQLSKLDKVFIDRSTKDLDGEVMVNCVQSFVDNTEIVQKMFDGTIGSVTDTMEKIRRRQKKWEDQQKAKNEDVEMAEQ